MIDVEVVAIGMAAMIPIYSMMWKIMVITEKLKNKLESCKYCKKAIEPTVIE